MLRLTFFDYAQLCCPYNALQICLLLHIPPEGAERPIMAIGVNDPFLYRVIALSTNTGQSGEHGDQPQRGSWLGMSLIETFEILF